MTQAKNLLRACAIFLFVSVFAWAAKDVVTAIHGTITKLDAGTKTIVIKTGDGVEHTLKFVAHTTVRGVTGTGKGAKDAFHGLTEGSEVVAHYTTKGAEDIAVEVDKIGKDGVKAIDGTVTHIDRGAKTMAVKTADGTEQTFTLSGHAAADAGKGIEKGSEKSAHVTVYYTEDAGKKIAHWFE
jgi:hypothetical protein